MPTQRTKKLVFGSKETRMVELAVEGMHLTNAMSDHDVITYKAFYQAVENIMNVACNYDPDFMEIWNSTKVQGSFDYANPKDYFKNLQAALEYYNVKVENLNVRLPKGQNVIREKYIHDNVWLIMVKRECPISPYVVSLYRSGKKEWESGSYFSDELEAHDYFNAKSR